MGLKCFFLWGGVMLLVLGFCEHVADKLFLGDSCGPEKDL